MENNNPAWTGIEHSALLKQSNGEPLSLEEKAALKD